jgi:hypothetical protein
MLSIEFEAPVKQTCECCGGVTTRLTRFVYKDNDAFAIYYAMFSDNHPDHVVQVAVGVGEWGEETTSEDRRAFALQMRDSGKQYEVMIVNADESPWQHAKILGRMLNREEALKHPWIEEVFHITDHVVEEDPEIKAYFERQPSLPNATFD